jgi:hypothetical protein
MRIKYRQTSYYHKDTRASGTGIVLSRVGKVTWESAREDGRGEKRLNAGYIRITLDLSDKRRSSRYVTVTVLFGCSNRALSVLIQREEGLRLKDLAKGEDKSLEVPPVEEVWSGAQ